MDTAESTAPEPFKDDIYAGQHRHFLVYGDYDSCTEACKARGVKLLQATRLPFQLPELRKASAEEPRGERPIPTYIGIQVGNPRPPRTPNQADGGIMPIVMVENFNWVVKAMRGVASEVFLHQIKEPDANP